MDIDIIKADPAGNTTIFVMTPVERSEHARVAAALLAMPFGAEQVGFVSESECADIRLDMAGGEFCGNATRSLGLLKARLACASNCEVSDATQVVTVESSGSENPLLVLANPAAGFAAVGMPLPERIFFVTGCYLPHITKARMVDFGGIMHLILRGVEPDRGVFDDIKAEVMKRYRPPAFGVMFLEKTGENIRMTPVVYVDDLASTYFEGSCASGTCAAAIDFACEKGDGEFSYEIEQPEGTLSAALTKENGLLKEVRIEGFVYFSDMMRVTV